MENGRAKEKLKTERFRLSQLFANDGTAVIIHAGRDNYANVSDRYHSHEFDVRGPDGLTKATGDAGDRFACGVHRRP